MDQIGKFIALAVVMLLFMFSLVFCFDSPDSTDDILQKHHSMPALANTRNNTVQQNIYLVAVFFRARILSIPILIVNFAQKIHS